MLVSRDTARLSLTVRQLKYSQVEPQFIRDRTPHLPKPCNNPSNSSEQNMALQQRTARCEVARSLPESRCLTPFQPTRQGFKVRSASIRNVTVTASRRTAFVGILSTVATAGIAKADDSIELLVDDTGFGQHAVRQGDLVLMHYTGSLEDGQVFDSTKGGLKYRDGGEGVFRPVVVRLSGYPQPGICLGLQQAVEGMKIGGKRSVRIPAQLGFGQQTVLAPYAVVPGGSTLRYDIELLRVSSVGPDMLVKGISRCGAGGAGATADNCRNIEPAEFF